MTDSVQVWRTSAASTSAYTSRPDWGQAVRVWSGLGSAQPYKVQESTSPARDLSQERFRLFLPYGVDVTAADRIMLHGHWWEVDGEPRRHAQTSRRHTLITVWRAVR